MKILILTRRQELRHIEYIVAKLAEKHEVFSLITLEAKHPFWFNWSYAGEEYHFFNKVLKDQAPYWKKRIYDVAFGFPKWSRISLLRHLKHFYKPPQRIFDTLKEIKPDIVLATNLPYSPHFEDYDYALACNTLNIPLIAFVPVWDALTTKARMQAKPDKVFCWTLEHKKELIKYHKIPEDKIQIVGCYTFEGWLKGSPTRRDKFCKKYNLNDNLPIYTYLCSSPTIAPREEESIENWCNERKNSQIIISPHPQKPIRVKYLPPNVRIIPEKDFQTKYDIYFHSEELYTINSSSIFEATLAGSKVNFIEGNPDTTTNCLHFKNIPKDLTKDYLIQDKLPSELVVEYLEKWYN